MKAAQIISFGDPTAIKINTLDKPEAGEGQVLVEVHAASLNPWDTMVRNGAMKDLSLPVTAGGDFAGIVAEIGPKVTGLNVGDKVYGGAGAPGGSGAFAEFAAANVERIAKMPGNINFEQAAALPLVSASALQALTDKLGLSGGQKIFIHGGAGGIGSIAIQIAKHIGAYVATTATGEDVEYIKQLGADEVIDYKSQDFAEVLSGYDAVFDTVGGDDFNKSLRVLKSGGKAASMIAQADQALVNELGVTAHTMSTDTNTETLDKIRELVEAGVVDSRIGKIFPLDQTRDAFEARESGAVKGKIVLRV